ESLLTIPEYWSEPQTAGPPAADKAEDCLSEPTGERVPQARRWWFGWLGVSDLLGSFGYLLLTKGRREGLEGD
ncbi:hypothetical protein KY386_01110, partial [Candidatus Parcubacteria bacterium]|nr:hypothetical protein [Candidatus Parcubacteria bacterium]